MHVASVTQTERSCLWSQEGQCSLHRILQQLSWCLFVCWHSMSQCLHCWHILRNRCSLHLPTLCATGTVLLQDCFPNPSRDGKRQAVLLLLFLVLIICLEILLAQNLALLLMKKGRSAHVEIASRVLNYRLMLLKHNYLGHCYQLFFPLGNKALYDILCNPTWVFCCLGGNGVVCSKIQFHSRKRNSFVRACPSSMAAFVTWVLHMAFLKHLEKF